MNCENCNIEHDGTYGSGRFCSSKCAKSFSTKNKRKEINQKISKKLKNRKLSKEHIKNIKEYFNKPDIWKLNRKKKISDGVKKYYSKNYSKLLIPLDDILNGMYPKYQTNHLKCRLIKVGLKKNKCEVCNLESWQNKNIICELHHIDGNRFNHKLDNLQMICPNCHSQTENFINKKRRIA